MNLKLLLLLLLLLLLQQCFLYAETFNRITMHTNTIFSHNRVRLHCYPPPLSSSTKQRTTDLILNFTRQCPPHTHTPTHPTHAMLPPPSPLSRQACSQSQFRCHRELRQSV